MIEGKVSTCLYISRDVLKTAKDLGLNVSKVSENALVEAVGRLQGTETRNGPGNVVRGVRFILSFKTVKSFGQWTTLHSRLTMLRSSPKVGLGSPDALCAR
jgi:hypothetical protein